MGVVLGAEGSTMGVVLGAAGSTHLVKILTFVLALASVATTVPVAPSRNQTDAIPSVSEAAELSSTASLDTYDVASTGDNRNAMVDFRLFDFTEEELSTAEVDQSESDDAEPSSNDRLHVAIAADTAPEGRSGKLPYKRFPPCYVKCFDSEGIDAKTWPAIGDIRDLSTHEFCHSQAVWVARWALDHLNWCVHGECSRQDNKNGGRVYYDLCGKGFWD